MSTATDRSHRGTIFCTDAEVISQREFAGRQHVLRLRAPDCARTAAPGTFVHLRCHADIPMRRPLSIMRASAAEGWIEVLYKVVGAGLDALSRAVPGDRLSALGPIGKGFVPDPARPRALLLGGGVGIPPLLFLAETLTRRGRPAAAAFMGSELPFPFELRTARDPMPGVAVEATATLALLDDWQTPARLASNARLDGCYRGFVTALAETWIASQPESSRREMQIYSCGPTPMLKAVKALADRTGIPAQLCLEEFMACAVGGCAGCVVPVVINGTRAMKRVCVDGPVFDAAAVFVPT